MVLSVLLFPLLIFSVLCIRKSGMLIGINITLFLMVVGTGLYAYFGHYAMAKRWQQDYAPSYQLRQEFLSLGSIPDIIEKLRHMLAQQPNHPEAWVLLGKLYTEQGQRELASDAFQRADAANTQETKKHATDIY